MGQTDRRTDGRIAASRNALYGREGHNIRNEAVDVESRFHNTVLYTNWGTAALVGIGLLTICDIVCATMLRWRDIQ